MYLPPPPSQANLNVRAITGISGSISIAFWVVVFSPQIIVNFRRQSAEGLSITFLAIWLAGDVFNVLGAVLQGVLPTMIILALYYTFADIVLLFQCLYYRHRKHPHHDCHHHHHHHHTDHGSSSPLLSSCSSSSFSTRSPSPNLTHLSSATPLLDPPKVDDLFLPSQSPNQSKPLQTFLFNTFAVLIVSLAGTLGWYVCEVTSDLSPSPPSPSPSDSIQYSPLGQLFGYLCAVLYLVSRVPQIFLNYRRRSCEGVSLLFFLFACLGNMTYVISILAYVPPSSGSAEDRLSQYWKYIGINASWLLGSVGTLALDIAIFIQFFIYGVGGGGDGEDEYENLTEPSELE